MPGTVAKAFCNFNCGNVKLFVYAARVPSAQNLHHSLPIRNRDNSKIMGAWNHHPFQALVLRCKVEAMESCGWRRWISRRAVAIHASASHRLQSSLHCQEVEFRSEGDATHLAQVDILHGNTANGQGALEEDTEAEKIPPCGEVEGLVRFKNEFSTSLEELRELRGGRLVVDLVAAWEGLSGKLSLQTRTSKSSQLLLCALKLVLCTIQRADEDNTPILSRSLAIAYTLADLQMDAEVLVAGLLHDMVEKGLLDIPEVEFHFGVSVSHILHDCSRFKKLLAQMDILDDSSAKALRKFCLAYHDVHAIIVEIACQVNSIRFSKILPRYRQQIIALETMQVYAPLAHAVCSGELSLELEDNAFRILVPDSYEHLEKWLNNQWINGNGAVEKCKVHLSKTLQEDPELQNLIDGFVVTGRYKSRFSTMKKLLKDGRKLEEVYDVLGLRVVVNPKAGNSSSEDIKRGYDACYKVLGIARTLWKEVPRRFKDYIARPKSNGYESLHATFHIGEHDECYPSLELQIRTVAMDTMALGGDASHALYKGGLTDPKQVQNLHKLLIAAAKRATLSVNEPSGSMVTMEGSVNSQDQVFMLFDKNNDGVISMTELREVMGELGANRDDAQELMKLVDKDADGSLTSDEFADFQKQAYLLRETDKKLCSHLVGIE